MANAYATIASGGWRNKPKAVTEVRFPDGKVDDLGKPQRVKVFDSAAMYEVTKILQANIKGGTGTQANIGCPAGGKTGTTEDNKNAWFVGYTPKLATAVWVGFPKANIPMSQPLPRRPGRRRHVPGGDLGHLHEDGQAQLLRRVPKAQAIRSRPRPSRASTPAARRPRRRPSTRTSTRRRASRRRTGAVEAGKPQTGGATPGQARRRRPRSPSRRRRDRRRDARSRGLRPRRDRRSGARSARAPRRRHAAVAPGRPAGRAPRCYRCSPMAKEEKVEFEGEVIEALPNAMFRVKLDNEHVVLGHVAGKMRRFRIRILPGDRVRCELSPYDLDRARIVYRHR